MELSDSEGLYVCPYFFDKIFLLIFANKIIFFHKSSSYFRLMLLSFFKRFVLYFVHHNFIELNKICTIDHSVQTLFYYVTFFSLKYIKSNSLMQIL